MRGPDDRGAVMSEGMQRYSHVAILLDWLSAPCVLGLLMVHVDLAPLRRFQPYHCHKSIGITVLLLTGLRSIRRFKHPPRPHPDGVPARERRALRGPPDPVRVNGRTSDRRLGPRLALALQHPDGAVRPNPLTPPAPLRTRRPHHRRGRDEARPRLRRVGPRPACAAACGGGAPSSLGPSG